MKTSLEPSGIRRETRRALYLGRPSDGEARGIHVSPRRGEMEPSNTRFLLAIGRRREAEEGGADGMHAKAAHHPQHDAPRKARVGSSLRASPNLTAITQDSC